MDIIEAAPAEALLHLIAEGTRELIAMNDAERATSELKLGDVVRIKAGGHSDEHATITGITHLGTWALTLESGMPLTRSSRGLELVRPAVALMNAPEPAVA